MSQSSEAIHIWTIGTYIYRVDFVSMSIGFRVGSMSRGGGGGGGALEFKI